MSAVLKKYKQALFVRNSVLFSMNAYLAFETIMALRQEVKDFTLDYGCCHNGQFACWTNFQSSQDKQNLLPQLKRAS